jgi:site-specific recombinase XerD
VFEKIFEKPSAIAAHRRGPFAAERESYLRHLHNQGSARNSLRILGPTLVIIARDLKLLPSNKKISRRRIETNVGMWLRRKRKRVKSHEHRRHHLISAAKQWLSFLGNLEVESDPRERKIAHLLPIVERCANQLELERGFAAITITSYRAVVIDFLFWITCRSISPRDVGFLDLDKYIAQKGTKWSRRSMAMVVNALKSFLQFGDPTGAA